MKKESVKSESEERKAISAHPPRKPAGQSESSKRREKKATSHPSRAALGQLARG